MGVETIDEKHNRILSLAGKYVEGVGLKYNGAIISNEIERYMGMGANEIKHMTPEECGEAAVILSRFAFYIQMEINKLNADIQWCETQIDFMIARDIENSSQFVSKEYKRCAAIRNNDAALQLQTIVVGAKTRLASIDNIPDKLRTMVSAYTTLMQGKRLLK